MRTMIRSLIKRRVFCPAVREALEKAHHEVLGLSHTRSGEGLVQLDLTKREDVERAFEDFRPNWVIHCAAERRPDVAEKVRYLVSAAVHLPFGSPDSFKRDPEGTRILNAQVPEHLASLSKKLKYTLVYISTDYVFDGTSPPYTPSSTPNPLQLYGQSKRDGELAVLGVAGASVIILRVPVLYGPAPRNSDSAINILLDVVQDQSGKTYKMDHYATRYPTNVLDIAQFLVRLSETGPALARTPNHYLTSATPPSFPSIFPQSLTHAAALGYKKPIPPILHYSAAEPFTKYEICLVYAKILGLPHGHIIPDAEPPSGPGATTRPRDCQLYTRETEDLRVGEEGDASLGVSLFEEWWSAYLKK
ncbi:hypothetical protein D9615_008349 [Tricholomella constricta]|uniref:RmlD-like substrate binding domain-containing protein n=1 Tax=Tricholomella constricta TaxID=117010 RepID=A0A8H5HE49_9AGAR|nr:hypothetical protein D9615_008349 [Tricholomella constricta]